MDNDWTKVLGFPGYRVYKHEIDEQRKHVTLWIRRKRGNQSLRCPGCGRRVREIHEVIERTVRDLAFSPDSQTIPIDAWSRTPSQRWDGGHAFGRIARAAREASPWPRQRPT